MAICLIGLGSNLGDRQVHLERAVRRLAELPQVRVLAGSSYLRTPPVGGPSGQGEFLNAALRIETSLSAWELLQSLQQIEQQGGRRPGPRWGPRPVDLDLLLYGDHVLRTPQLELPHPRLSFRRFVLQPAVEVAADMMHPVAGWTIRELYDHLDSTVSYVAIAGGIGAGKTELAYRTVQALSDSYGIAAHVLEQPPLRNQAARTAGHGNSAGLSWRTEIEFLDQRAKVLNKQRWPSDGGWVLSDFWFGQALAFAQVWLEADRLPEFKAQFDQRCAQVATPKLRVVLRSSTDDLMRAIAQRGGRDQQSLDRATVDRLRSELERRAAERGRGPVLAVDAAEQETNVDELAAAIAAMKKI